MNRYDNYLKSMAAGFDDSFSRFILLPEKRIGQVDSKEKNDEYNNQNKNSLTFSKSWDQMSHEERNKYLYG